MPYADVTQPHLNFTKRMTKNLKGGVDSKVELLIIGVLVGLAVGALIAGFLCYKMGYNKRKNIAEAAIGSAEEESKRIINEAYKTAEAKKKEMILEGKDEIHRLRNESDKETS